MRTAHALASLEKILEVAGGSTPCGAEFRKDFRKRIRENQP